MFSSTKQILKNIQKKMTNSFFKIPTSIQIVGEKKKIHTQRQM